MTSTTQEINISLERYFTHLNDKIDNNQLSYEEVKQQCAYPFIYECLKLTDWNVARLRDADVFLAFVSTSLVENVQKTLSKFEQTQKKEEKQKDIFTLQFLEKYVPKKYHVAIEEVEKDSWDGYFIYLTNDYVSTDSENHTISEQTLKEIRKKFKYIVPKEEYLKMHNLPSDWRF